MLLDPERHKRRQTLVKNVFSAKSMERLAPTVLQIVQRAIRRISLGSNGETVLDISDIYRAITVCFY